jgi:hypothetical protein
MTLPRVQTLVRASEAVSMREIPRCQTASEQPHYVPRAILHDIDGKVALRPIGTLTLLDRIL